MSYQNMSYEVEPDAQAKRNDDVKIDRRSFLALGASAAVLALVGLAPIPARAANRLDLRYVITDRRYPESLEFGQVLSANGSVRLEVTDGLTKMWQEALVPLWREPGGAIVGLTSREVWICLTEQARSQARRSVFTGRHVFEPQSGSAAHLVSAPRQALSTAATIERQTHMWPRALAKLISHCPSDASACDDEWRSNASLTSSDASRSLVSWIIA